MKHFVSYKQAALDEQFDALVVGSGPGSLVTAACLARQGKRCLVLERHYVPGGYSHVFKRRQYEWDVGIHYIGEVTRPTSMLSRLFRYVSDGSLEWEDMGEVYDRIRFGDDIYDFVTGRQNWLDQMKAYFPSDADCKALDLYMERVIEVSRGARNFFAEKVVNSLVSTVAGGVMRRGFMRYARRTTLDVLREITDNPKLIGVLTGQFGDYGLPPAQSSFAMHAMLVRHYFNGGAYPVGGSSRIFEAIAPVITDAGGIIAVRAEVEQIVAERGKAVGVRMADGRVFRAPVVISGAGIPTTVHRLMNEEDARVSGLENCTRQLKRSAAHLSLYLGFKGTPSELELPRANWWYYPPDYDHDANVARYLDDPEAPFPVVYASFPSAKDPTWEQRYPDRSTVDVITLAPYEWFQPWENTRWGKRGDEYDGLKERLTQRLLTKLYELEPQLEPAVDHVELSTPLSTRHFCNYERGEIYGLEHDPTRFEERKLRPRTGIKGFYLTGQDVATAGVGGAMVGGVLCASAVVNKNLLKEVMLA